MPEKLNVISQIALSDLKIIFRGFPLNIKSNYLRYADRILNGRPGHASCETIVTGKTRAKNQFARHSAAN